MTHPFLAEAVRRVPVLRTTGSSNMVNENITQVRAIYSIKNNILFTEGKKTGRIRETAEDE